MSYTSARSATTMDASSTVSPPRSTLPSTERSRRWRRQSIVFFSRSIIVLRTCSRSSTAACPGIVENPHAPGGQRMAAGVASRHRLSAGRGFRYDGVEIEGSDVAIPAPSVQPLGLAIHELAANAAVHGYPGRVDVFTSDGRRRTRVSFSIGLKAGRVRHGNLQAKVSEMFF